MDNLNLVAKLGDEAKDNVTGFTGIVTGIRIGLYGCPMLHLQPPQGADGKVPDPISFDEPTCSLVRSGAIAIPKSDAETIDVDLGDEVLDPISKLKGTLIAKVYHLNGCVRFGVQAGLDEKGNFRDAIWLDGPRLQVIKKKKETEKEAAEPKKKPGGPMLRGNYSSSRG